MDPLAGAYEAMRRGRLAEARVLLESARTGADPVAWWRANATLAQVEGRPADAVSALSEALALAPSDASVHLALGQVLAAAGDRAEALSRFAIARQLAPEMPAAWLLPGVVLLREGRYKEAAAQLRQAVQLSGGPVARRALADAEFARGRYAAALVALGGEWKHETDPGQELLRARCLRATGAPERAASLLRAATAAAPGVAALWAELGAAFEDTGDAEGARDAYRAASRLDPRAPAPLAARIALDAAPAADDLAAADALSRDPVCAPAERALLHYALGRKAAAGGEFAPAAAHFIAANSLRRGVDPPFDREAYSRRVDRLVRDFDAPRLRAVQRDAVRDPRPVFVVGMPRSGSTLVERILGAHPEVRAAGERRELPELSEDVAEATGGRWPRDGLGLAPGWQHLEAARYLADPRAGAARRMVDKQPYNSLHLGLVTALFADARIVWCRRDPRDVALSIFSESFSPDSAFATDLDDIAHVLREHERLRRHWQAVLPLPMLEVRYESLVEAPEAQARRLVAFLDLPWDPACLDFHRMPGAVQTMSRWQVRQPVHARSVGRWRHFADWFDRDDWRELAREDR